MAWGVAALFCGASLLGCGGSLVTVESSDSGAGTTRDAGSVMSERDGGGSADVGTSRADTGRVADASVSDGTAPAHFLSFPQVPNTHGRVMTAPRIVTIVASNDVPTDGTDTAASLQGFSDAMPGSAVWNAVSSEYGLGALTSGAHFTGPAIVAGSYTVAQLVEYVGALVNGGTGVASDAGEGPTANTVYLLYLPNGALFADNTDGSCGYHTPYPSLAAAAGSYMAEMAVLTRCTPYAVTETQLGELTRDASHLVVEAATDPLGMGYNLGEVPAVPWTGSVWVAAGAVEVGELCDGTRIFEPGAGSPPGGWEFQRMYSNKAAAAGGDPCVPAYDEPYYTTVPAAPWYSAQPGATVSIPLTGWSAGATHTTEWLLNPFHVAGTNDPTALDGVSDGGVVAESTLGSGTVGDCYVREGLNDGTSATLLVTMPANAQSGDYLVLTVHSFREDPSTCYPPLTEDEFHYWPVGLYVP